MFTGIIKGIGTVESIIKKNSGIYITIKADIAELGGHPTLVCGASIAVDGVCQTVLKSSSNDFTVESIPETLRVTAFGNMKIGSKVNLEPAIKLGDSVDGHLVQGHTDCTGKVLSSEDCKDGIRLRIKFPESIEQFVVYKGSITINGVSLTISKVGRMKSSNADDFFEVSLIEHTIENTNLGFLKKGDKVNLEVDMMARYAVKMATMSCCSKPSE